MIVQTFSVINLVNNCSWNDFVFMIHLPLTGCMEWAI